MKKPEGWPLRRLFVLFATLMSWAFTWVERLMPEAYQGLPWLHIAVLLTVFVSGGLAADLANPTSWLRRWLAWKRRAFDLEYLIPKSHIEGEVEYCLVTAKINFIRDVQNASLCVDVLSAPVGPNQRAPVTMVIERNSHIIKGESRSLTLISIPLERLPKAPLPQAVFGHFKDAEPPLVVPGSTYVFKIRLDGRLRHQTYSVHLRMHIFNSGARGRMFCMGEDYDAFGDFSGPAFN
jgi:hypothetical protein